MLQDSHENPLTKGGEADSVSKEALSNEFLDPIIVAFAIHTGVANGSSANPCFVMIDNQSCCFSADNSSLFLDCNGFTCVGIIVTDTYGPTRVDTGRRTERSCRLLYRTVRRKPPRLTVLPLLRTDPLHRDRPCPRLRVLAERFPILLPGTPRRCSL